MTPADHHPQAEVGGASAARPDHHGADGDHEHGRGHPHGHGDHGHDHEHGHGEHEHGTGVLARIRHALTPHSHDHSEVIQGAEEASAEGIRAAWVSLVGMGATAALQLVIVALSGSVALLADTVHNLGHLATTIPLILAFRLGRRPATRRYTYGFRRAEDLVGLLIGLVIALSVAWIVVESVRALVEPRQLTHLGWVLAAALVGAAGNELVAVYRIRSGRRIGSAALIAEGQHARADGLTSLAVVIGVAGAWLGFPELDAIIGLVIAAVIVLILVSSTRVTIRRLMDGVEEEVVEAIEQVSGEVAGVSSVDRVRARWSGHRLETDLVIAVDGSRTVADAHEVADRVHQDLVRRVPHLHHATVQVTPTP